MKRYDYIICGSGCSGLLLAHAFSQSKKLTDKEILLIDSREAPCKTTSFGSWTRTDNQFDSISSAWWEKMNILNHQTHIIIGDNGYKYRLIRGMDLHEQISAELKNNKRVTFMRSTIKSIEENNDGALVTTDDGIFAGSLIFNSLTPDYKELESKKEFITWWQHFKAFEISTIENIFNTTGITLMDFRVRQDNVTRFAHVLPFSKNKAFVEIVAFEPDLKKQTDFDELLKSYITDILKINQYTVGYTEAGIIPMTEFPFKKKESDHIINIGIRSGTVKPSTGYSFNRINSNISEIIHLLEKNETPEIRTTWWKQRFKLYDNTLLDVLHNRRIKGSELFSDLFTKNKPELILKFLDEETSVIEEISIFARVRIRPFIRAIISSLLRAVFRKKGVRSENYRISGMNLNVQLR